MLRLTCRELAGRVGYAQFLHDGSEVAWKETGAEGRNVPRFLLPAVRPDVEIPVIEILLK
jgi:alpha-L-fucosidase